MADQNLTSYISTALAQGKTKEDIYKELLGMGWSLEVIQSAFVGPTTEKAKEDSSKRTIHIIVTIGAILVGAGIFSFIASNWQDMGRPLKVGIILVSMIIAYAAGWYLREHKQLAKTGGALILLGTIIYGAGIFLVAQMFNIRANWPDGFLLWMLGIIAIAYVTDMIGLHYFAIVLGVVAIIGHPFDMFQNIVADSFLMTSTILLAISTIITFAIGLMIRKKIPDNLKDFY